MNDHSLICFGCMHPLKTAGEVCPNCGHDNTNRSNGPGYLSDCILADQYFMGKVLGHGGFGVTYLGFDLNLKRKVAVKEYYPRELAARDTGHTQMRSYPSCDAEFRRGCERALDEGRMIATLRNTANIVQVFNAFPANGTVYTVMEYIPGRTLNSIVTEEGPMNWRDAYKMMRPILLSLENVHRQNVIHRDVSPDNIMFNRETNEPVLLDFGAAHLYQGIQGHSYTLRPGYAPPEQYSGLTEQDGRTDEYAACATMYFLLTGKKPMDATQRAFGDTPMESPRASDPSIPADFENVLLKGMSVRIPDRYKTMSDLVDAFDEIVNRRPEPPKQNLAGIIVGCALIVIALILMFIIGAGKDKPEPTPTPTAAPAETPTETSTAVPAETSAAVPAETPTETSTAVPTAVPQTCRMMRSDVVYKSEGYFDSDRMQYVMNTSLKRNQVATVTFVGSTENAGKNAVNVSENEDGTVIMWYTQRSDGLYDLYFGAQDKIILPESCSGLFLGYTNLTAVSFSDAVDTSSVQTMDNMFAGCSSLTELDLSCFDTSKVWNMYRMFADCTRLKALNLTSFDTRSVTYMHSMFLNCTSLTELDLTSFDTRNADRMMEMFRGCTNLNRITVSSLFSFPESSYGMFLDCGTDKLTYK